MNRLVLPVALVAAAALPAVAGQAPWRIPDPAKVEHPGAADVPASSPATYPDEQGFRERVRAIVAALATNEFQKWRTGYFAGGDPGKYLPGAAMARLMLSAQDAEVAKYMNDERSYKEHYHFAAVNWARFLPLFGDALAAETKTKLAAAAAGYTAYHSGGGTENHKTMWMTSANVLPHCLEGDGTVGRMPKAQVLAKVKDQLRQYVKGLYTAGMGEWDSSTYLMFTMNGMMNVYDFSPDPECRLLAKAALDWMATAYALKYTDGVLAGPEQRGFAAGPMKKIADQTGYLWWGSSAAPGPDEAKNWLYTMHAATSGWRPNAVITNVARRNLGALPFEVRSAKPNYWFGLGETPRAGVYPETLYVTRHYTMGTLWAAPWSDKTDQMTRFQMTAVSPQGGVVLTGGHPTLGRFEDAGGRHDQRCQVGPTVILMSQIPPNDPVDYVFFSVPEGAGYRKDVDWHGVQAGEALVALYPLGGEAEPGETRLSDKDRQKGKTPQRILKVRGRRVGFIVHVGDADAYDSLAAFLTDVRRKSSLRPEHFQSEMFVDFTRPDGTVIKMQYQAGRDRPLVKVNDQPVALDEWPVYECPYVVQKDGVLSVNDGRDGFTVDFTGDLPVYKPWQP